MIELLTSIPFKLHSNLTDFPHHSIRVEVFFVKSDGTRIRGTGKIGDSLLDVVVNNSIDLDGFGACEGTLTCSTCHLIFKQEDFDRLPGNQRHSLVEELKKIKMTYFLFILLLIYRETRRWRIRYVGFSLWINWYFTVGMSNYLIKRIEWPWSSYTIDNKRC